MKERGERGSACEKAKRRDGVLWCVADGVSVSESVRKRERREGVLYRVAKTDRIPHLYRSFSAKEPYI